eukprot:scaffold82842_cov39-Attheya_sp.AAC.1
MQCIRAPSLHLFLLSHDALSASECPSIVWFNVVSLVYLVSVLYLVASCVWHDGVLELSSRLAIINRRHPTGSF